MTEEPFISIGFAAPTVSQTVTRPWSAVVLPSEPRGLGAPERAPSPPRVGRP